MENLKPSVSKVKKKKINGALKKRMGRNGDLEKNWQSERIDQIESQV